MTQQGQNWIKFYKIWQSKLKKGKSEIVVVLDRLELNQLFLKESTS